MNGKVIIVSRLNFWSVDLFRFIKQ